MSECEACAKHIENPMDQINKAIAPARPFLLIVAFILLCIAGAKYFGVSVPQVRGDWWQLIILALGLKSL